jgi:hypothetical protein
LLPKEHDGEDQQAIHNDVNDAHMAAMGEAKSETFVTVPIITRE